MQQPIDSFLKFTERVTWSGVSRERERERGGKKVLKYNVYIDPKGEFEAEFVSCT